MAIGLVISLTVSGEALAKNCMIQLYHLYLPPLSVDFQEGSTGATLTLLDTAIGEPIVVELDRQVVTKTGSTEKISLLVGTETIKSGKFVNDIEVVVPGFTFPSGNRQVSIKTTVLIEGFNPEEEILSGTIICRQ